MVKHVQNGEPIILLLFHLMEKNISKTRTNEVGNLTALHNKLLVQGRYLSSFVFRCNRH